MILSLIRDHSPISKGNHIIFPYSDRNQRSHNLVVKPHRNLSGSDSYYVEVPMPHIKEALKEIFGTISVISEYRRRKTFQDIYRRECRKYVRCFTVEAEGFLKRILHQRRPHRNVDVGRTSERNKDFTVTPLY